MCVLKEACRLNLPTFHGLWGNPFVWPGRAINMYSVSKYNFKTSGWIRHNGNFFCASKTSLPGMLFPWQCIVVSEFSRRLHQSHDVPLDGDGNVIVHVEYRPCSAVGATTLRRRVVVRGHPGYIPLFLRWAWIIWRVRDKASVNIAHSSRNKIRLHIRLCVFQLCHVGGHLGRVFQRCGPCAE